MTSVASASSSWIEIPPNSDFSIDNIPFGVCSFPKIKSQKGRATAAAWCSSLPPATPRCCTAIGNYAVDLHLLAEAGLLDNLTIENEALGISEKEEAVSVAIAFHPRIAFGRSSLNEFMSCEKRVWVAVRNRLMSLFLLDGNDNTDSISPDNRLQSNATLQKQALHPLSETFYHLPATIGDYTDFYSSREHATNVGIMFRGKDDALQPNWLHMPIGYHGRSSSVYPSRNTATGDSMSTVRRPCGQLQIDPSDPTKGSTYGSSDLMDFELEVAFFVGGSANRDEVRENAENSGKPLTVGQARDRIFGYVLMNDWSARDIQKWEYVPLGPFTSKNFATTISTWVVTPMALEPFRCETTAGKQGGMNQEGINGGTELSDGIDVGGDSKNGDPTPLEYLRDPTHGSYDISLSVSLQPESTSKEATQICKSNLKNMYWSSVQQLTHHSVTGCPIKVGDLLASGTISGKEHNSFGSMLELSWNDSRDITLDGGEVRRFLKDGDAVIMEGWCKKEGLGRVGFGQCSGRVLPAIPFPNDSQNVGVAEKQPTIVEQRYSKFKLYGFWRSSCAWRVRIALSAKGIPHETEYVNLFEKDQTKKDHSSKNPMQQVPVLEFVDGEVDKLIQITQSLAIIEFLESAFPNQGGQLLPADPVVRAKAKEVAEVINSGTQPLQNMSVMDYVDSIARSDSKGSGIKFGKQANENGLSSLEALLAPYHDPSVGGGPFALGTHGPTLADVCLIPQLYNARRFKVDCSRFLTLLKIQEACKDHAWFRGAEPELQTDFTTCKYSE